MSLSEKLKRMKEKGFRYDAVASLLGVSRNAVTFWALEKRKCASKRHRSQVEWLYDAVEDLTNRFKAQFGEAS